MKKLINKILNKKTIDLNNDGKIETLRAEIGGVFSQFKRMHDKLGEVNEKLQVIAQEEKVNAERALKRVEKVESELQANNKLQEKVKDFII